MATVCAGCWSDRASAAARDTAERLELAAVDDAVAANGSVRPASVELNLKIRERENLSVEKFLSSWSEKNSRSSVAISRLSAKRLQTSRKRTISSHS